MKNTVKQITKEVIKQSKKDGDFYYYQEQLKTCGGLCSICNHYLSCKCDIKIRGLI